MGALPTCKDYLVGLFGDVPGGLLGWIRGADWLACYQCSWAPHLYQRRGKTRRYPKL